MIDNIIFGDNQFFGINHISEDRSRDGLEKFNKLERIIEVLDVAYSNGINGFMLTANERISEICGYLRQHSDYWGGINIYPSIPYPYKYVQKIGETGIYKSLIEILTGDRRTFKSLFKGGIGIIRKDVIQTMRALVDLELQEYSGLNIKVVFLQNILTDLMLGLGLNNLLYEFSRHIEENYNCKAGFITLNLPLLVNALKEAGIERPVIMSPYNSKGFFMNPGKEACEEVIARNNIVFVAMAVLASGAITPREAIEYVSSSKRVNAIIFGASTKQHIIETKSMIEKYFNLSPERGPHAL